jgi:hypothetical protein
MTKSLLVKHLIPKSWALIWSWSPLCCYNSLHSSGKVFHYMLERCCGDLLPFSHKRIVRSGTDVGLLGLACSRHSNSSQRCSMGLRSGLGAGQSSSFTPISTNHFCMDLALFTGVLSFWNRKGPSLNCCHKVGTTESSRMSLYDVALRFPFTGNKGPSPNHEKQP